MPMPTDIPKNVQPDSVLCSPISRSINCDCSPFISTAVGFNRSPTHQTRPSVKSTGHICTQGPLGFVATSRPYDSMVSLTDCIFSRVTNKVIFTGEIDPSLCMTDTGVMDIDGTNGVQSEAPVVT